jgi:hypothetical protein
MAGQPVQDGCRAQCNNIKNRWEIVLARNQDGGCVKEQMAGPQAKMAPARNVIKLKKWWEIVMAIPDPRSRVFEETNGRK